MLPHSNAVSYNGHFASTSGKPFGSTRAFRPRDCKSAIHSTGGQGGVSTSRTSLIASLQHQWFSTLFMPSFPVSTQGRKSVPLICRARSFLNTANDVFATMSCVVASMNLPLQHPRCSKVMANFATLQHLMQQESTTSWTASKATLKDWGS